MKKKEDIQAVREKEIVWSGINEICRQMGGVAVVTVLNYRRDLDFPLIKDGGIMIAREADVNAWANDLGIENIRKFDHTAKYRIVCRRRRAGPGETIQGDQNKICERLRIATGTLLDALRDADNPFQKVEGSNQYTVDLNRWQDYVEDHRLRG